MDTGTDGGSIVGMNTSKLMGFLQGAFYPIVGSIIAYVIANLGTSGLVSSTSAVIICGILSVVENAIQTNTGKALFGLAR